MVVVVAMMMAVCVALVIVGAMLRIERRFKRRQPRAEPAQHVFDHMIAPDAQPVADDLNVNVPIADVPGEPRQLVRVRRRNLDQRFGPADNPHDPAIVEHDAIAIAQSGGLRQIKQKPRATLAAQDNAAAMALIGIKRDGIDGGRGVPMAGGSNFVRTLHV
jgi:hypothetical protein